MDVLKTKVGILVLSIILLVQFVGLADDNIGVNDGEEQYFRAILPTPVYSIKEIPSLYYDYDTLQPRIKTDEKGHIRELEYIALKDTKFRFINSYKFGRIYVYEVETSDYPSNKKLYIDSNFVVRCLKDFPGRDKTMPPREDILASIRSMVGLPYRWGGNYADGIEQLLKFYPIGDCVNRDEFIRKNKKIWTLEGVDCSGMLYQAANGATPRNTSQLVEYGEGLDIEGLGVEQILQKLEPLDLIVWSGHVVVVYDKESVIESRPRYSDGGKGGVRIHSLKKRLKDIISTRKPVNEYSNSSKDKQFVIRRFL